MIGDGTQITEARENEIRQLANIGFYHTDDATAVVHELLDATRHLRILYENKAGECSEAVSRNQWLRDEQAKKDREQSAQWNAWADELQHQHVGISSKHIWAAYRGGRIDDALRMLLERLDGLQHEIYRVDNKEEWMA